MIALFGSHINPKQSCQHPALGRAKKLKVVRGYPFIGWQIAESIHHDVQKQVFEAVCYQFQASSIFLKDIILKWQFRPNLFTASIFVKTIFNGDLHFHHYFIKHPEWSFTQPWPYMIRHQGVFKYHKENADIAYTSSVNFDNKRK